MKLTKNIIDEITSGPEMLQFRDHLISGLCLAVHPTGEKIWRLYWPAQGKEEIVSIGPYPKIDLRAARKIARRQLQKSAVNVGTDIFLQGNPRLIDEQKRVKLSQIIKERENVKFRPNPLFQDLRSTNKNVYDLRLKEEKQRKIYLQKQEKIEIVSAWEKYQKTKNLAILSDLLRSENVINNPLPIGMLQEIAYFLDQAAPQSQDKDRVDDDRVFMTYWRHTELENGVEPLLMDLEAVGECVTFMEAIGRPISFKNIKYRIKLGYAAWRKNNAVKLEKSAKVIREMKNQSVDAEGKDHELDNE